MKQEYTDKMKFYQGEEYKKFLKEKCVYDSHQFLFSSFIYLNYALITAKLYEDTGKKNISESNHNPFYNKVEVLGWNYNAHTLLNKLTLEWISHISNALDCLLQYVNSALRLSLAHKDVREAKVIQKLSKYSFVENNMKAIWMDDTIKYIRSVYNYGKHTLGLYGGSSFLDEITGQRDIRIPDFKYRNTIYETKSTSELIGYYEIFIGKYIDLLDSVDSVLHDLSTVGNRYHVGKMIVEGISVGENGCDKDIVLHVEFDANGENIKKYWIEDIGLVANEMIEIMLPHSKGYGQYLGGISVIDVKKQNEKIGELHTDMSQIEDSALYYHKYFFVQEI